MKHRVLVQSAKAQGISECMKHRVLVQSAKAQVISKKREAETIKKKRS